MEWMSLVTLPTGYWTQHGVPHPSSSTAAAPEVVLGVNVVRWAAWQFIA
jgi:hypothetical protein